jgi:hypothetical protein
MNKIFIRPPIYLILCSLSLMVLQPLSAQEQKALPSVGKRIVARKNPWDKLQAIDIAVGQLKLDWKKLYGEKVIDIDVAKVSDKDVAIPFALGIKICDGLLAVKAKDKEKLNECSDAIESLAEKMGVTDGELSKAKEIKLYANNQEWARVVLELGMLQKSIEESIDRSVGSDARRIIMVAGWLQGVRYISTCVSNNYSDSVAGIMREPAIVKELLSEFSKLPEVKQNSEIGKLLKNSVEELGKLVDVPMHGSLTLEAVNQATAAADRGVKGSLLHLK